LVEASAGQGGAQTGREEARSAEQGAERESDLITRILAGERELFHELIRPYERGLYLTAYSVVLNEADAEDCAQDAVLKAYKGLPSFRGDARFRTWLTAIVLNEARSRLRQASGHPVDSLSEDDSESGDYTPSMLADWRYIPSRELERQELRQALEEAMAQLTPEQREVLLLRDVRGLSVAEAAEATGASENLVKVRLFRARLSMQKLLAPKLGSQPRGDKGAGLLAWLSRKAGGR
jgi:RNA polymerase sigma-70 factor (ECF subfamily)